MLYAHKPTSESLNPAASLTNVPFGITPSRLSGLTIHEPLRPAKDAAIHTSIHGDSKSLPNNRTAKVHLFINLGMPLQSDNRKFYDYLTIKATVDGLSPSLDRWRRSDG